MSEMIDTPVDGTLDATGLNCPEPVMMLHQHIRDLAPGGLLKVIATDPSTRRDIPKFCVFLDHELVGQHEDAGTYLYWIRKNKPEPQANAKANVGASLLAMW
ncbi:sulfurtransferase TusA [Pseudomonas sp. H22_DOA]|nr:sulfurtransferase TusA [Pseudomonas sp. H22_DOA]